MKMELPVRAPGDGRVTAVHCRPGELVQPDTSLIEIALGALAMPSLVKARMIPPASRIVEVGPRDGLQNEAAPIATADKIAFVDRAERGRPPGRSKCRPSSARSGCRRWPTPRRCSPASRAGPARATPRWCRTSPASSARSTRSVDEVAIFAAASETFSRKNINQGIDESLDDLPRRVRRAHAPRACPSAPTCPRRSAARSRAPSIPPRSRGVSAALIEMGAYEVAVSDTIGIAHPGPGAARSSTPSPRAFRSSAIALHFHDTRGTALANVLTALQLGITTFDASAGGLGGCPYAPGATGNLATEDLLYMLDGLGIETGVSLDRRARGVALHRSEARPSARVAIPGC